MRVQYEQAIYDLMKENPRIIALVADSESGKYADIEKEMPDRYFNFGIAENTMVAAAAGLANDGWIPVIYGISNFLVYRSFEFIRNDLCLDNRNVKLVGLGTGVIQNMQGPTHHTLEDISCLRALPNMTILSPGSPKEVPGAIRAAIEHNGPVYLRIARMYEPEAFENDVPQFKIGGFNIPHKGTDLTLFVTGAIMSDTYNVAVELEKEGISVDVVNMNCLKPVDKSGVLREAKKTGKVLVVEEHNENGALGSIIAEILVSSGTSFEFKHMSFGDEFCREYGWYQDLKRAYGLSPEHIADACRMMVGEKK